MSDTTASLRQERVTVACINAQGSPELYVTEVEVTEDQYALGEHYDLAEANAEAEGYEGRFGVMISFDSSEQATLRQALGPTPAEALIAECGGDVWGEHERYPRAEWKHEVADDSTHLGYWDWVVGQIDQESPH